MEIFEHRPQKKSLLDIFLAEVGEIGLDDVEEFGADCGDAAEERWAGGTLPGVEVRLVGKSVSVET